MLKWKGITYLSILAKAFLVIMHIIMAIADYTGYPPLSGAKGLIGLKAVLIGIISLNITVCF